MSLSSEHMLVLMAYADGELEGAERAEAERLLATEADAARFVAQVGDLGDLVHLGHDDRSAKTIATFDVSDAVMSRLSSAGAVGVTSLAEAREKRASSKREGGSRLKIGAGIAAALALAASVLVFAQHRDEETPMAKSSPAVQAPGAPAPASSGGGTGVEVSTVNSPGNSVSVFYLPSANELSTSVVVWVDETGEK